MNRKRLTRQDSREETRKHLLDAAQRLIAKNGLSAASVEEIAETAGYTRGAFYSNFGSKDDLFLELLSRDHRETRVQLAVLIDDSLPLDHIHTRAREIYGQMFRSSESFMNWSEARMLAARNSKFRAHREARRGCPVHRILLPARRYRGAGTRQRDGHGLHEPVRRGEAVHAVEPRRHDRRQRGIDSDSIHRVGHAAGASQLEP